MESDAQRRIREEVLNQGEYDFPITSLFPLEDDLKREMLKTGLGVFGGGGSGKSNAAKIIAQQLQADPMIQLKIIDKVQNWVHDFGGVLYQDLDEETALQKGFYFGPQNFLYNCKFRSPDVMKAVVSDMVAFDYELHWRYKEENLLNRWILYIIEEAQSILANVGSKDPWNAYISEGRNFNLSFIFIARRMTQLNAKLRENMGGFLFSRMSGYNNLKRVRWLTNEEVFKAIPKLGLGQYIYWNGSEAKLILDTPLYESTGLPRLWNG